MPCYHPVLLQSASVARLLVACGQCRGCRLERSRQWAVRCVHEASLHERNCFITLTYDDAHLPVDRGLHYRDFQLFLKRLRKRFGKVRFYMCGEYGEIHGRPHFHCCLFGFDFGDRVFFKTTSSGSRLYVSEELAALWPSGFSSVADVSFESAAYVARYVMKKLSGDGEKSYYNIYDPSTGEIHVRAKEFCRMSLKPGIASDWLRLYWPEVAIDGKVRINGHAANAPRFYLRRMKHLKAFEEIEYRRFQWSLEHVVDYTPARLAVREIVEAARVKSLVRSL